MIVTILVIISFSYLPSIIAGGLVAHAKGDFFSRGIAMCAITGVFGLIALIIAPPSKARAGDKDDYESWHVHGARGGLWLWTFLAFLFILRLILKLMV